ncbi:hypothetical protein [Beijerinckia indica]|uniref:Uncharacterized protein n=1 Tax=Beijerinckia indica subsp. indica (strain ATCC 9039 / DSM 1715 / NCIMB 8712) TaxID=395963 RepID=B2IFB8_BEII9|nr:hypothetical protein [Beijerinckia indica]ACB95683.1 conserved hypothetical protein [Beijerinckia indica subsp. indica ATCC 9039]
MLRTSTFLPRARSSQKMTALAFLLAGLSCSSAALAEGPFTNLAGYWGGEGTIKMNDGTSERIRCKGSYAVATGGGAIEQKLRCASDSYKLEISSNVIASGTAISGSWTEATRNASGAITGTATPNLIHARVDGAGFSAGLAISTSGRKQSVTITPQGSTDIAGVSITLHRS